MTCLIDTHLVLDLLLKSSGQADAERVLAACDDGTVDGYLTSLSYGTIAYLLEQANFSSNRVRKICFTLVNLLGYATPSEQDFLTALNNQMADFESAIQAETAISIGARYIITQYTERFTDSPVPAITPTELLQRLTADR